MMQRHPVGNRLSHAVFAGCTLLCGLFLLLGAAIAGNTATTRIVSLDLCTDWMLARHADPHQVAALSPLFERYPPPWRDRTWPAHDGSLERILELKPDLVISGQYNALLLRGRLKALGVTVEVMPTPQTLDGLVDYEQRFLTLLQQPGSPHPLSDASPHAAPSLGRLLLLGPNGIGTGRHTFEDDVIQHAGWTNYLTHDGLVRLDLEQIATDPPDAIVWARPEHRALANQFARHPVLHRVVPANKWLTTDYWRWQCPGPWMWELIPQLQR